MSKYFTEGYVIDTKKADLIAERETDTEFGIYKYSVYKTRKLLINLNNLFCLENILAIELLYSHLIYVSKSVYKIMTYS